MIKGIDLALSTIIKEPPVGTMGLINQLDEMSRPLPEVNVPQDVNPPPVQPEVLPLVKTPRWGSGQTFGQIYGGEEKVIKPSPEVPLGDLGKGLATFIVGGILNAQKQGKSLPEIMAAPITELLSGRPADMRPPTQEEMAQGQYAYQPTRAREKAYEEWETPGIKLPGTENEILKTLSGFIFAQPSAEGGTEISAKSALELAPWFAAIPGGFRGTGQVARGAIKGVEKTAQEAKPILRELATSEVGGIGKQIPKENPYLKMPIERVRKDAEYGVKAAKEALTIREGKVPTTPQPILKAEAVTPTQAELLPTFGDKSIPGWARTQADIMPSVEAAAKVLSKDIRKARSDAIRIHKEEVSKAIAEGKPVPSEVLKDYPDLAKQAPSVTTEAFIPSPVEVKGVVPEIAGKPPIEPPITAKAIPGKEPEFAGNIRLEKFQETTRPLIKEWVEKNPEALEMARRGTRSFATTEADARTLVESVGGDFNRRLRRWKPGEAYNDSELVALSKLVDGKRQELSKLKDLILKGQNSVENQSKLALAETEFGQLMHELVGGTAEAGRALSAKRIAIQEGLLSKDTAAMEKLLHRFAPKGKIEEMAQALTKIDMDNPVQVAEVIRSFNKIKWWEYPMEIYLNSLLSGVKSWTVNIFSNQVNIAATALERGVAGAFEFGLARLQGRPAERFVSEAPASVIAAIRAVPEGARAAVHTAKFGISPMAATKYEYRPHVFTGKFGKAVNMPMTVMEMGDAVTYSSQYRAALQTFAIRQSRKEGLQGLKALERQAELVNHPSSQLMAEAAKEAEYRLWRGEPGKLTAQIMKMRDTYPVLRIFAPFVRTPTALIKYGLERSPFGFASPRLWRTLGKSPEAADLLARATIGSIIGAGIAYYFWEGKITGAPPTSVSERDLFYRQGKQPWAINIGGNWVSYQRLEPLNQVLSQTAAVVEAVQSGDDKDAYEKAGQVIETLGRNLVSQTYMSGLSDLLDAINDPEQSGTRFLDRAASSLMVPYSAMTRTVAQIMDRTVRQPKGLVEQVKANVPVLSEQVRPKLTALGEPTIRKTKPWLFINISEEETTAVDAELARLKFNIGFVGDTVKNIDLDDNEKRQYQIVSGNLVKQAILDIIDKASYAKASDEHKKELISKAVSNARTIATDEFLTTTLKDKAGLEYIAARYRIIMRGFPEDQRAKMGQKLRTDIPLIDAVLNLTGSVSTLKTREAVIILVQLAQERGIPLDTIAALREK